jgi:imidazolonepropionase-like amidohydrolase
LKCSGEVGIGKPAALSRFAAGPDIVVNRTRENMMLKPICFAAVLGAALLLWTHPIGGVQAQQPPTLVIEGGTLIDGNGGAPVTDALIVMQGNRVTNVSKKGQATYPANAQIIHADGKFILPGLWEAETVYGWFGGEASILHGVTSISDIATKAEVAMLHKEAVNYGKTGGPRTFIGTGYIGSERVTGYETPYERAQVPKSVDEARAIAKRFIDAGSDMVMFFDGGLPIEYYQAAYDEAKKAGKARVVRPTAPVGVREAVAAGADHISHSSGIDRAIAKDPSKYNNELDRYSDMDDAKAADLIQFLVKNNVSLSPTLIRKGMGFHEATTRFQEQDRNWWLSNANLRAYYPEHLFEAELMEATPPPLEPAVRERRMRGYQNMLRFHGQFVKAGGHMLPGCNSPFVVPPGLCIHQELEVFEAAGLTTMQMIQAATKWPAQSFKVADKVGTIESGKLADVIIVNADPLQNIRNLRQIDTVVFDGKVQELAYHASYRTPFMGGTGLDGNSSVEDLAWVIAMKAGTAGGQEGGAGPDQVRVGPPGILTISPTVVTEGSPTTTLVIKGANFVNRTKVFFDNKVVPSRRVSSTELAVTLDANLLKSVGRYDIYLQTPGPLINPTWHARDGISNMAHFLVNYKY